MGRFEGNRSLEKRSLRWKDKIKLDLKKVCYDPRNWMDRALKIGSLMGLSMGGNEPPGSLNAN